MLNTSLMGVQRMQIAIDLRPRIRLCNNLMIKPLCKPSLSIFKIRTFPLLIRRNNTRLLVWQINNACLPPKMEILEIKEHNSKFRFLLLARTTVSSNRMASNRDNSKYRHSFINLIRTTIARSNTKCVLKKMMSHNRSDLALFPHKKKRTNSECHCNPKRIT